MPKRISTAHVRANFNDLRAVVHYTRAAYELGLWASESIVLQRYLPPPHSSPRVLEAGCGAGRVSVALHGLGYRAIWAFDFAEELLAQATSLSAEREINEIVWFHADATKVAEHPLVVTGHGLFDAIIFAFNGLMQIPGRRSRRRALRQLATLARPGAPLIFTTHDREHSTTERAEWARERAMWDEGKAAPILREFGDRYFEDEAGATFMHLPNRAEIMADLKATGWTLTWDAMRRDIAKESRAVRSFSDECRFWVAHRHEG